MFDFEYVDVGGDCRANLQETNGFVEMWQNGQTGAVEPFVQAELRDGRWQLPRPYVPPRSRFVAQKRVSARVVAAVISFTLTMFFLAGYWLWSGVAAWIK